MPRAKTQENPRGITVRDWFCIDQILGAQLLVIESMEVNLVVGDAPRHAASQLRIDFTLTPRSLEAQHEVLAVSGARELVEPESRLIRGSCMLLLSSSAFLARPTRCAVNGCGWGRHFVKFQIYLRLSMP